MCVNQSKIIKLPLGNYSGLKRSYLINISLYFNRVTITLQPVSDDILHHTSAFEYVMRKGEELLETRAPGKEKKVLRKRIDDLDRRWKDVLSRSTTREAQIKKVLQLVEEYSNVNSEFTAWLDDTEKKLSSCLFPAQNEDTVGKQQELLEVSGCLVTSKYFSVNCHKATYGCDSKPSTKT